MEVVKGRRQESCPGFTTGVVAIKSPGLVGPLIDVRVSVQESLNLATSSSYDCNMVVKYVCAGIELKPCFGQCGCGLALSTPVLRPLQPALGVQLLRDV